MTINELKEKRNMQIKACRNFLDARRTVNGTLTAEDDATYTRMEQEVTDLGKEIARLERQEAMDAELSKPTSKPLTSVPGAMNGKTGRASDEYKKAMIDALRSNFKQFSNVLLEGTDSSGGYLVPVEYDERLVEKLNEENIVRRVATVIKTSGEHKINIAASTPAAAWVDEGESLTFGDSTFAQKNLDAHKLHVAVKVTEELLYDSAYPLEENIIKQFSQALANAEEDAFLNGNGTGKPLGIFAEDGGAEVGVTTASATAITADEIISLVYSLKRPYRKNAKFILNDQTVALLRKLKDNNGQYIWQPALQAGEADKLLGYEVLTSQYAPVVEAGKAVIAFGDFSYYNIGDRGTRSFQELKELFAGNGMVGFLAKERVDGKLILPEAVQLLQMRSAT